MGLCASRSIFRAVVSICFSFLLISHLSFGLWANSPSDSCAKGLAEGGASVENAVPANAEAVVRLRAIDKAVSESQNGLVLKAGAFKTIRAVYDGHLDTIRYEHINGRVPEGSEVIIPLYHGGGTIKSHGHAMVIPMHILTSEKKGKSEVVKALSARDDRLKMAVEIVDDPGHGLGPNPHRFTTLDDFMAWKAQQFRELKEKGLKIIPLCRSASTGYLLEFARRYPQLIDGIILMSPVHPTAGFDIGFDALFKQAHEGRVILNEPGVEFVQRMYHSMNWSNIKEEIKGVPILVLVGGKDVETPQVAQDAYRELTALHPLSRFHFEPEAGHEVLGIKDTQIAIRAYGVVQEFIHSVVKQPQN